MLECCAPLERIKSKGISINEFSCLANCNGLNTITKRGDRVSKEEFLKDLERCSASVDQHMVVSFSRKVLGKLFYQFFLSNSFFKQDKLAMAIFRLLGHSIKEKTRY